MKPTNRKLLAGSGTALGVIIFLLIIGGLQYIFVNNPKRWDLTQTGSYTLAPQSKKVLAEFKEKKLPITVLGFFDIKENSQKDRAKDLFEQYRDNYSDMQYNFVDPDQNRSLAVQHKVDTYPLVIFRAGQKEERITTISEENVTNALMKLLRTDVKKVYFLKGHGELSIMDSEAEGFSEAKNHIEKQNYKTEELVLLQTPSVPEDATLVIIAGPKTDPMDAELESLKQYIQRGGKLFVLLNPFSTPKLTAFLKDYGITSGDDIIIDKMSRVFGGDYLIPVITSYIKFPITKDFTLASFFPQSRSVKADADRNPLLTAQDLALTSQLSWTINQDQLNSGNANFDEKSGTKGPLSVMAVSTVTNSADKSENAKDLNSAESMTKKAGIVVTGSSLFASNKFIQAVQANKELFLNTVSWLAEDENLISIRPKSNRAQPLILSGNEPALVFLIPVVIIPVSWLVVGISVYFYRRRTGTTAV